MMSLTLAGVQELPPEERIVSFEKMCILIPALRRGGVTVILAQGVFDIVHVGHVGYLQASRRVEPANSLVVVGIENDDSVKLNKGEKRPINPHTDRAKMLSEFCSVGFVFVYPDCPRYTKPQDYIARYQALSPSAISVPTWDPHRSLKEWQASQAGTQLALVEYRHTNSTTRMLQELGYKE